ncbi:ABC transporter permease, partial [Candidatus Bipolaricaulota bacterium]|nr:ABC transporter permease [Candidatus Bipolaricaulota bacterium]
MNLNTATLAWRNIRTRQARSWLTILGILIGVTAIVTLISIGTGVENAVLRQFEDVGLDVVLLIPKEAATRPSLPRTDDVKPDDQSDQLGSEGFGSVAAPLDTFEGGVEEPLLLDGNRSLDPVRLRRDVPEVTEVGQIATRVFSLSAGDVAGRIRVMVPSLDLITRFSGLLGGFEIAQGRSLDLDGNQVVIGARTATEMGVSVGDMITIGGFDFSVVGILEPSGESHAGVGGDLVSGEGAEAFQSLATTDDAVFVSYERALALWPDVTMSSIVAIRIRTGVSVTDTIARINEAVERQGISMTPVSTQALADNVQRTLGMVEIVL